MLETNIFDDLPVIAYKTSDKSFVYFGIIYELHELLWIYETMHDFRRTLYVEHVIINGQSSNLCLNEYKNSIYAGDVPVSIYDLKTINGHVQIITINNSQHEYEYDDTPR